MAEGQVIIEDNGSRSGASQGPFVSISDVEGGIGQPMEELRRGRCHHINGVQLESVVVSSGGVSTTTESPSDVLVVAISGGTQTVTLRVRNQTGFVEVCASENLQPDPDPSQSDVYDTDRTTSTQISMIKIDKQTIMTNPNTKVGLNYS